MTALQRGFARFVFLAAVGWVSSSGMVGAQTFDLEPPAAAQMGSKLHVWATHYYVYAAKAAQSGVEMIDAKGKRLGVALDEKDWCLGGIEGTFVITLPDGQRRTYNYAGAVGPKQADCAKFFSKPAKWVTALNKQTYALTPHAYGTGAHGIKLVPFRTIAVDPSLIPLRSVVFIPDAVGTPIPLPDGGTAKHDGYFLAGDTGGAIRQEHLDLFTGTSRHRVFMRVAKASKPQTFSDAYIVNSEPIRQRLLAEHSR